MYYGGFTYTEARSLPIYKVRWFLERISEENKKQNQSNSSENQEDTDKIEGLPNNIPKRMMKFR